MSSEESLNKKLSDYIKIYLESQNYNDEFEIRFGTNYNNNITRIKFDNIIKKLKSLGFKSIDGNGKYHLNIQNEYIDVVSGKIKLSNVRTEIKGITNIQQYCKKNSFNLEEPEQYVSFIKKNFMTKGDNKLYPIDFKKFEFRVNYKVESNLQKTNRMIDIMLKNWNDSKKTFRFIKRFTFVKEGFPYKFDLSILKTSKYNKNTRKYVSEYNINNSNVFNNIESYEVEMELLNEKSKNKSDVELLSFIKKGIKIILSGLQNSNFPISYIESKNIIHEYVKLTNKHKNKDNILFEKSSKGDYIRKNRKNFIGPSSITLEKENIIKLNNVSDNSVANIHNPYTVTDKADGLRKLLFINNIGKIYLIDINLNIEFTGCLTKNKTCFNSILDGEHILHDKTGNFINLYMCFDIYYYNNENIRHYPLLKMENLTYENDSIDKSKYRLNILYEFTKNIDMRSIIKNREASLTLEKKTFYNNLENSILESCAIILKNVNDGGFKYETDGLIFTPINKSVGSNKLADGVYNKTWIHSLKWKPSEYNTIDFLITTKKNDMGEDIIKNLFENGKNMNDVSNIKKYKTIELRVGFDESKHGFLNPFMDVLNDNIPDLSQKYDNNNYKPVLFYPNEPTPNYDIYNCNILLENMGNGEHMYIEDKSEVFENGMIVEFKFVKENENNWQWIPIRVRHDKTADYKKGNKNYGNAYHVAESVWKSIHNPVTESMITNIEETVDIENNEVYYKKSNKKTTTSGLRDFHNKYIKKFLIKSISSPGNILIDMTVGKAGDLWKWYESKLKFILGIDVAKMNIEDRKDGACARYLKFRSKYKHSPRAIFLNANSSLQYMNGDAFQDDKSKIIFNALMGEGGKSKERLGKVAYKNYGIGKEGFNIASNMFSIHYFFESFTILNNFLKNLSDTVKIGGYTTGCCYDGKRVFNMLKNIKKGSSKFIIEDDVKMWNIKKMYSNDTFPDSLLSIGYRIDVYQESINKTFPEWLVNFDYLTELLENYGFSKLDKDELKSLGLKKSIDSFEELHNQMQDKINNKFITSKEIGNALKMSVSEKEISFLNNYFIFKKNRNVDTVAVHTSMVSKFEQLSNINKNEEEDEQEIVKRTDVIKYKRKVKLI